MNRKNKRPLSTEKLLEILPHRYPMFLVDTILDYEEEWAIGKKLISMNEWYFKGHYPENPIMPGSLLLEALSQVGTFMILQKNRPDISGKNLLFAGAKSLRFLKEVKPGDEVILYCYLERSRMGIYTVSGRGEVSGNICISAEMTFALVN
ncbi:3-hydroxyacyl-ACP dehydratase FabZ [Lachnospiraceae bacterium 62-35]